MSKQKRPRVQKTKQELLTAMKNNEKFKAKMKFTREKFYPAVLDASKNIEDAKMWLSSISTVIMQKFLHLMKEKTFKDLNLVDALDEKEESYEKYKALLELFDDMSVFDAKDCFESMKSEIDLFIRDEMQERPLSSLKTKWIDEL